MAVSDGTPVTEDDPHNWTGAGPYIEARVQAEDLVLDLPFAVVGPRMAQLMSPLDYSKAERELG